MKAFVAMPFAESFDQLAGIIDEVCKRHEIKTFRIDRNLSFERHIDIAIRREIRDSDLMIAVLTGDREKSVPNPNVAFEVGYAQGIGLETVLLAEAVEHLPFDFQQQRTTLYHGDLEKFRQGLDKELGLLVAMLRNSFQTSLKSFYNEITRCLRIVLPPQYRLFGESRGLYKDNLWYSVSYREYKSHFMYVMYTKDLSDMRLACWLCYEELRPRQKAFFKKHYDVLRKQLGHDILLEFSEKSSRTEFRNRELAKEVVELDSKSLGTREALMIAMRVSQYIEAFEPLYEKFLNEESTEES